MSWLTPDRVVLIFVGEYGKACVEPPVLPPQQYELDAMFIHDMGGRPTDFPDPRGVAIGCNWSIVAVPRLPQKAITNGNTILYRPALDPRLRGLVIWHEVCHCYLRRYYPDASEADAWLLTGAVVLSWKAAKMPRERAISLQRHAPEWFLDLRRDYVRWLSETFWAAE